MENKEQGRYIYCVAKGSEQTDLGKIGIENSEVYTIPSNGLIAVVHDCGAKAYDSKNEEKVKEWIKQHENVIEKTQKKFETIVPLSFNVIIKGENASKEVTNWLQTEKERLERNLEKVKGKEEFGVQITWDPINIGEKLSKEKEGIKSLLEEMEKASKGQAYFIKQKIKKALKQEMEKLADEKFKQFYSEIKKHCYRVNIDKNKKTEVEKEMLMNLSCLVAKEEVKALGKALDKINKLDGFSVRFTGPWPPYSFVT
ncbi:MAG: GvpL/GvpF family gas vesicle protein [Candidatus Diapherotrites archaeon]